jgi:hypothetical protein
VVRSRETVRSASSRRSHGMVLPEPQIQTIGAFVKPVFGLPGDKIKK